MNIDYSKIHIIPDRNNIEPYLELVKKYGLSFEYNDFFMPFNLDKEGYIDNVVDFYKNISDLPKGCTFHGSFLDVTIFSSDARIVETSEYRMRQSMDIAKRLGAKAVIFHTNFIPNFKDDVYEENWADSNYYFIGKLLEEYPDMCIYMENMFDMNPYMLERLARMFENHDRFGVCLDYAHVNVFGTVSPKLWIDRLAPYIKHVHINDNNLEKDSHLALGQGLIDYKQFFEYYNEYFKDASILIEVSGIEKIEKSLEYLNTLA